MNFLISQSDDPELLEWLGNAREKGGAFLHSIATAALVADHENYPLLRPLLMELRRKYPKYEASDVVKQELRDARERLRTGGRALDQWLKELEKSE